MKQLELSVGNSKGNSKGICKAVCTSLVCINMRSNKCHLDFFLSNEEGKDHDSIQ